MSFTQPLCAHCWNTENPDRPLTPERDLGEGNHERCCVCGFVTVSGIYIRRDPTTVPYPLTEENA